MSASEPADAGVLIGAIRDLPAEAVARPGDDQARFDAARDRRRLDALGALAATVGFEFGDLDELTEPRLGGISPLERVDVDPIIAAALARVGLDGGASPSEPTPRLESTERVTAMSEHLATPPALLAKLYEGWVFAVADPTLDHPVVRRLDAALRMVWPGTSADLVCGVGSALGRPTPSRDVPTVLVQLSGMRSVMLRGEALEPNQIRLHAGQVLAVPVGVQVVHLPLDLESVHLDYGLEGDEGSPTGGRPPASFGLATWRSVTAALHADGWPVRLASTATAAVIDEPSAGQLGAVAVAGRLVDVSTIGMRLLEALTRHAPQGAADLAATIEASVDEVHDALRRLWFGGLLEPAPAVIAPEANDRLVQVASGDLADEDLRRRIIGALDEQLWRAPHADELAPAAAVEVHVQPIDAELVTSLEAVAQQMNGQFFRARLGPLRETVLAVRVRPGPHHDGPTLDTPTSDLVGATTRKLTWVYSLIDASDEGEGGWPLLVGASTATSPSEGHLSSWPSFRSWSLQPMRSGERIFVLGRLHGSAWS